MTASRIICGEANRRISGPLFAGATKDAAMTDCLITDRSTT